MIDVKKILSKLRSEREDVDTAIAAIKQQVNLHENRSHQECRVIRIRTVATGRNPD
jgi:hypothetical protein